MKTEENLSYQIISAVSILQSFLGLSPLSPSQTLLCSIFV